jgi:hypothetical protein
VSVAFSAESMLGVLGFLGDAPFLELEPGFLRCTSNSEWILRTMSDGDSRNSGFSTARLNSNLVKASIWSNSKSRSTNYEYFSWGFAGNAKLSNVPNRLSRSPTASSTCAHFPNPTHKSLSSSLKKIVRNSDSNRSPSSAAKTSADNS